MPQVMTSDQEASRAKTRTPPPAPEDPTESEPVPTPADPENPEEENGNGEQDPGHEEGEGGDGGEEEEGPEGEGTKVITITKSTCLGAINTGLGEAPLGDDISYILYWNRGSGSSGSISDSGSSSSGGSRKRDYPFKCTVARCEKRFKRSSKLSAHLKSHKPLEFVNQEFRA
eukprot:Nk52_evm2s240 gene=Nk52_evmTU2s240